LPGSSLRCPRCGTTISNSPERSLERSLALTFTGMVLLTVASTMPFISVGMVGRRKEANLLTGALALGEQGMWSLASVVIATTMLLPALKLAGTAYVLVGLRLPRPLPYMPQLFRWLAHARVWSMVEVYLLGVFVAYVKLRDFATIEIGTACYALGGLMVVMVWLDSLLAPELVWQEMEARGLVGRPRGLAAGPVLLCESCGLVAPVGGGHGPCPRCGAARHARKPESVARTWALVVSALILYVPANVFPVMTVVSFGKGEPDTILSGVKALYLAGMWPLALLVFFASITVPVLKITGLSLLLATTQRRSQWRLRDRTVIYRIVEFIGRWSMIDIFMISILAGLVRLGSIATIEPGIGAISFAGVVIITMFAAETFDPRLMWDAAGENA
jgi:paraquat-inducible protein A